MGLVATETQRDVASSSPTADTIDPARQWGARPWLARIIRLGVLLLPILVSLVAAITVNRLLNTTPDVHVTMIQRVGILSVIATFVLWAVDKLARRLLPLAALLHLSLVFPDQAPSRFRSALRSGSSRRLERKVEEARTNGLAEDPGVAARQVVEMIGAIGDHDRRTRGHCERVRLYADLIGEEMNLSEDERQKLQWGALLHDLGKLMVPPEILNKKGKPDPAEWAMIERHPSAGMKLITPMNDFLGEWVHGIGGHHERWDGEGYPKRLRGSEIPRAAAIVAVADSFEVMTAVRSYKKAMSLAAARAELTKCAGTHFSPEVVRAFLSISLRRLRLVAGPLTAVAQMRFFGESANTPAAGTAIGVGVASAAGAGAAGAGSVAAVAVPIVAGVATVGAALVFILPMAAKVGQAPKTQPISTEVTATVPTTIYTGMSGDPNAVPQTPVAPSSHHSGGSGGSHSSGGSGSSSSANGHATSGGSTASPGATPGASTGATGSATPPAADPPSSPSSPPATSSGSSGSGSAGSGSAGSSGSGSGSGSSGSGSGTGSGSGSGNGSSGNGYWWWHGHHYGNNKG